MQSVTESTRQHTHSSRLMIAMVCAGSSLIAGCSSDNDGFVDYSQTATAENQAATVPDLTVPDLDMAGSAGQTHAGSSAENAIAGPRDTVIPSEDSGGSLGVGSSLPGSRAEADESKSMDLAKDLNQPDSPQASATDPKANTIGDTDSAAVGSAAVGSAATKAQAVASSGIQQAGLIDSAPEIVAVLGDSSSESNPEPTPLEPLEIKLLIPEKSFRAEKNSNAIRVSYDDIDLLKILNMEPVPVDAVSHFPGWLKALDGVSIRIRGFMYPTFEATGLTGFTLARDNGICCFVRQPKIYDIIAVEMAEGVTTDYIEGKAFDVEGVFRIQPEADETELYRLYRIENARVLR